LPLLALDAHQFSFALELVEEKLIDVRALVADMRVRARRFMQPTVAQHSSRHPAARTAGNGYAHTIRQTRRRENCTHSTSSEGTKGIIKQSASE